MTGAYHSRKVLVTGAGGFIASHLVEALVEQGAGVRAFVRYNSRGDPGLLSLLPAEILREVDLIAGDLRDLPAIQSAMQDVQIVFHLGALIAIPYSYVHPAEVVESNVLGTLNVLLAGREAEVDRIVHTSSSEVYGTARYVPIDENHPLQGQSPYSASKIAADKIAESFRLSFDLPVVTLRPFNTYGPRQSTRAVIPTIITQALTGEVVHLGNLEARRDLTYVSDTVAGFLLAGQVPGIEGMTINLGTGREVSILELAQTILELSERRHRTSLRHSSSLGQSPSLHRIEIDPERLRPVKSEVGRLLSDNRLAQQTLGWQPAVDLEEGLRRTMDWIAANLERYRPGAYQI